MFGQQFDGLAIGHRVGLRQILHRFDQHFLAVHADTLVAGIMIVVIALAPLAPWTVRNFRTLHHFQPLAPRYANETDELVPRGFNRWVKTWITDYASVEET
jgi:hypothetical protein